MPKAKEKPEIFVPEYYNSFKCIADKCRRSCCIDWEICIDGRTLDKYKKIPEIMKTVEEGDSACFRLNADGRCPHLNENGLCGIIISHGEEYLCDICKNHPRFINEVGDGRIEIGLGIVCEEACRIIAENEKPFSLIKTKELLSGYIPDGDKDCDFDPIPERDRMIATAEAENTSFCEIIASLKKEYAIPELCSFKDKLSFLLSLEILDKEWENTLKAAEIKKAPIGIDEGYGKYFSRLLIYFIYRHVSSANSLSDLRARLGLAIFSAETIASLFTLGESSLPALIDLARMYSAEIEYSEENTEDILFEYEIRV